MAYFLGEKFLCKKIAEKLKKIRLSKNLSQKTLAENSGVALGTLKLFERTGQISLFKLAMIASALNRANELDQLFEYEPERYRTLKEFERAHHIPQRGRK